MPNWDSLSDNQLVSNDALADAITNRYFALKAGQSMPSGSKCITSAEAAALLQLDESILPSTVNQMVVKSELRGAQTVSVRVKIDENGATTGVNFVDCDLYVGIDGVTIGDGFFFSPFDQTFGPYYGGQKINLVLQSQSEYSSPGVTNGKLQMQLYEGGEGGTLLMDTGPLDAPVHGTGEVYSNIWPTAYHMLPNTQYFVKAWSFLSSEFLLTNNTGYDINWYLGHDYNMYEVPGLLRNGESFDLNALYNYPGGQFFFWWYQDSHILFTANNGQTKYWDDEFNIFFYYSDFINFVNSGATRGALTAV